MCTGAQAPQEGGLVAEELAQVRLARPEVSMASIQFRGQSRVGEGLRLVGLPQCCRKLLQLLPWGPWEARRLVTAPHGWLCPREGGLHVLFRLCFM